MVKICIRLIFVLGWVLLCGREPDALYLTWVDDPTTTMTVVWHGEGNGKIFYRLRGGSEWLPVDGEAYEVPETSVRIHVSHIEGLKSDSTYLFMVEGSRREYKFRTLPKKLSREVRFVVGGDLYYYWGIEVLNRMNKAVAYDDPDFVVMGGDLAYTTGTKRSYKGRAWEIERWQQFFQIMQKTMLGEDDRMIPMVPVVGNHDVHRSSMKRGFRDIFYDVFPFPKGLAYRNMKIGNYLSLVLLDSGHTTPIEGAQTEWLKSVLQKNEAPFLFSVYHVGAYPSVYKYNGSIPELLRKNWVPLFEKAEISGAFEHHSHALKRTFPIRAGKKDPRGVIYFGDGSWGISPRSVRSPEELWYLAMSASINACWFIHLTKEGMTIEARTPAGEVKDRLLLLPRNIGEEL